MDYQPRHFRDLPDPAAVRGPGGSLHFPIDMTAREVAPGVFWLGAGSCAGWVVTDTGVVVIDAGFNRPQVVTELRRTSDRPVTHVIYSHGHEDHVFTAARFAELAGPETRVIAHALVPERLSKYELLRGHIARTNATQFHAPVELLRAPVAYRYPDETYWDARTLDAGGRRIDLFHGRGETDDATVVVVPDANVVFAGDFLISSFPNLGNPYKVPRYCRGWYETLERIRALRPRVVAPGHGLALVEGEEALRCLDDTIAALRWLHDEVVRRLNEGQHLEQMVAEVRLPPNLEDSPYLRQVYSRAEFAVMEIQRGYTGWYDGDPADLLPPPRLALAPHLRELIGDDDAIIARSRALWERGERAAAIELLQVLLRAAPDHAAGRVQRLRYMETLLDEDRCLMSRGVWYQFADLDRAFIGG
ncbi:MAG: alkyl sulfatase dimerization domain-containing protein [Dehalococcoidia bacterium]